MSDTAAVLEDLALSFDARASIDRAEGENISANAYENAAAALRRRALSLPPAPPSFAVCGHGRRPDETCILCERYL